MQIALTPGQAELGRVAFDGVEPVDRKLAELLFGPDVPVGIRSVVAAVCGARAGKSYILVALRLVWGMLVRDLSSLAPGQKAVALIIAPNDKLRREVVSYARGAVESKAELRELLIGDSAGEFGLRRPDGHVVRFEAGVAAQGGYGARGRSLTDFAMDETAFFRDSTFKVNDQEIFRAGSARVLPGGQTVIASTPWAESGLLWEMWRKRPPEAVVVHAPTLLLRDMPDTREYVERAERQDPDNAAREFGAQFMTSGTTVFFEGVCIDLAMSEEGFEVATGDVLAAGGDFGFRSDSSALLLVAMRGNVLHVFDGLERRPEDGKPLKPSVTIADFAKCIAGRCGYLMADQHYREAIAEHLDTHSLIYAPAPAKPAETYVRARMLLRESRVMIHPLPFRERLVQQMREVQGRPTSGGGMSIVHPRWSQGGHGDLVAALVLALWQVSGDRVQAQTPQAGTREWEQALIERRTKRWEQEKNAPAWAPRDAVDRGSRAHWKRSS